MISTIETWDGVKSIGQHRFVFEDGTTAAIAFTTAGIYDLRNRRFVPFEEVMQAIDIQAEQREPTDAERTFMASHAALRMLGQSQTVATSHRAASHCPALNQLDFPARFVADECRVDDLLHLRRAAERGIAVDARLQRVNETASIALDLRKFELAPAELLDILAEASLQSFDLRPSVSTLQRALGAVQSKRKIVHVAGGVARCDDRRQRTGGHAAGHCEAVIGIEVDIRRCGRPSPCERS